MPRNKVVLRPPINKRIAKKIFKKRWPTVCGKAYELSILSGQDLFLFSRNRETGELQTFLSTDEKFIPDYRMVKPGYSKGPADMMVYYQNKTRLLPSKTPTTGQKAALVAYIDQLLSQTLACLDLRVPVSNISNIEVTDGSSELFYKDPSSEPRWFPVN